MISLIAFDFSSFGGAEEEAEFIARCWDVGHFNGRFSVGACSSDVQELVSAKGIANGRQESKGSQSEFLKCIACRSAFHFQS